MKLVERGWWGGERCPEIEVYQIKAVHQSCVAACKLDARKQVKCDKCKAKHADDESSCDEECDCGASETTMVFLADAFALKHATGVYIVFSHRGFQEAKITNPTDVSVEGIDDDGEPMSRDDGSRFFFCGVSVSDSL